MKTVHEMPRKFRRWSQIVTGQETEAIACTPREAVYQRDLLTLYRYKRDTPAKHATPVLLVYSLVNKPSVLDLQPGRSVVEQLLAEGFDVYLVDWGIPTALDFYAGLDTYVNLYIRTLVRQVCKIAGSKDLHLLGYCMGGTMCAAYTALHPKRVRTLTLMAAPLRFKSDQQLYKWASDPELCKPEALVEVWRTAPAWSFDGYALLGLDKKPAQLKHLYDNIEDEKFLKSYKAMEAWVNDNIPVAAAAYAEFIRQCFLEDRLMANAMEIGGQKIKLGDIRCPVLILSGSKDHLVPPETTCCNEDVFQDQTALDSPCGHVGLSVGSRAHRELWPQVRQWMAQRSLQPASN